MAQPALRRIESYRDEFPIFKTARYLSTCSLGALSLRVEQAVRLFLAQWHEHDDNQAVAEALREVVGVGVGQA